MARRTSRVAVLLGAAVVVPATTTACTSEGSGSGHPIVAVSMYPVEEIVRTLVGPDLDVRSEEHTSELQSH